MKKNYFKYYKANAIVGFIIISGSMIGFLMSLIIKHINQATDLSYYQYPTASIVLILFVALIDSKLWNKTIFRPLYAVPDLSGRYEGKISFINPINNKPDSKNCAVEVIQTGSKVKVNCYFQREKGKEKTPSKSIVETIVKNDDDSFSLVFMYQNSGSPGLFGPHNGTNILDYICNDEGKFLKGVYYTDREPSQTRGKIEVKYISKNLKNEY